MEGEDIMVTYEVTATVHPLFLDAYESYMRERHIPDVLATGYFQAAVFTRAAPGRYRVRYEAPSEAALDRYLKEHASRLRADFASHFPEGVDLVREVWVALQSWSAATRAAG